MAPDNVVQPYLDDLRTIAGADAQIGFRGSLARGTVGNRHKPRFGQPIDRNGFDIDAFIVSDDLARRGVEWGVDDRNLRRLQREIYHLLKDRPEFQGLRTDGFKFRIFSREEARRRFGGEEMYVTGGAP